MKQNICPRCNKEFALQDPLLGILPGLNCQKSDDELDKIETPEFYNLSKIHRIQKQRDEHGKDLIQPYALGKDSKVNPDFAKAYPNEVKNYFDKEQLKNI